MCVCVSKCQFTRMLWVGASLPHRNSHVFAHFLPAYYRSLPVFADAFSVDWRSFQRQGGLELGTEGSSSSHQTLLMPMYDMNHIESLPKSCSSINLFNAGPHGEPAVAVIAPQAVMSQIESSGIVKEMLFENQGPSEDLFLENIQEAKQGRRQSAYAQFVE